MIGVMAVILTGTFALIQGVISLNKKIALRSAAYQVMDTKMEEARAKNFGEPLAETTSVSVLPSGNTVVVAEDYNILGQTQADIKEVTVTVHWKFKTEEQEIKTSTYVARGGIKK